MEVARSSCRNALKESGHTPDYGDMQTGEHACCTVYVDLKRICVIGGILLF